MNRMRISEVLFSVADRVRFFPMDARTAVDKAFRRMGSAIDRLGGRVRGCKCTSEDAERCASNVGGEWCECRCHDRDTAHRYGGQETN